MGNRIDLTNNIIATKSYTIFKYSENKELDFRVDFHNDEVIKNMLCFYYFANLTEDIFFDLFKLRASRGLSRINAI